MTNQTYNGILCVDKPAGFTSFDVVAKLRGILHTRKIGHSGTLDPMATGVLPVFVGNATRAIDLMENHDKAYLAQIRLGLVTDTLDITGQVLERRDASTVTEEGFVEALSAFRGEILQVPPMYSALKVGGKKLYELARNGMEVERKPRPVCFYDLHVTRRVETAVYEVYAACSKGAYIRSLADDLGEKLGCGGVLEALRRVEACGFSLENCLTLPQIQQLADEGRLSLLPVDRLFASWAEVTLTKEQERRFCNGAPLWSCRPEAENCRVYGEDGLFLGLGTYDGEALRSRKLFLS